MDENNTYDGQLFQLVRHSAAHLGSRAAVLCIVDGPRQLVVQFISIIMKTLLVLAGILLWPLGPLEAEKLRPLTSTRSPGFPFDDADDIGDVNDVMEMFFYRENTLTEEKWLKMLPVQEEINEMRKLLATLYSGEVDLSNILTNLPALQPYIDVTLFTDNFYIVHEKFPPTKNELFARGWGYAVIARKSASLRNLHHSAAHFESDGAVCAQAANLFDSSKGRSLVVAGASRYAIKGNSSTTCQPMYTLTDAAHAKETMFNQMNVMLKFLSEKEAKNENRVSDDVFIQWHGMAETSCLSSAVFISAGLPNNSIYDSDIPATRLMKTFNDLATTMKASTPRQDHDCRLTAGSNVFGRYVNGVAFNQTCHTAARPEDVVGQFVHIEQKRAARDDVSLWSEIVNAAFPPKKTNFKKRQFSKRPTLIIFDILVGQKWSAMEYVHVLRNQEEVRSMVLGGVKRFCKSYGDSYLSIDVGFQKTIGIEQVHDNCAVSTLTLVKPDDYVSSKPSKAKSKKDKIENSFNKTAKGEPVLQKAERKELPSGEFYAVRDVQEVPGSRNKRVSKSLAKPTEECLTAREIATREPGQKSDPTDRDAESLRSGKSPCASDNEIPSNSEFKPRPKRYRRQSLRKNSEFEKVNPPIEVKQEVKPLVELKEAPKPKSPPSDVNTAVELKEEVPKIDEKLQMEPKQEEAPKVEVQPEAPPPEVKQEEARVQPEAPPPEVKPAEEPKVEVKQAIEVKEVAEPKTEPQPPPELNPEEARKVEVQTESTALYLTPVPEPQKEVGGKSEYLPVQPPTELKQGEAPKMEPKLEEIKKEEPMVEAKPVTEIKIVEEKKVEATPENPPEVKAVEEIKKEEPKVEVQPVTELKPEPETKQEEAQKVEAALAPELKQKDAQEVKTESVVLYLKPPTEPKQEVGGKSEYLQVLPPTEVKEEAKPPTEPKPEVFEVKPEPKQEEAPKTEYKAESVVLYLKPPTEPKKEVGGKSEYLPVQPPTEIRTEEPKVEAAPPIELKPAPEAKPEEAPKVEEAPKIEANPPVEPKQEEAPKVEPTPVSEPKPEEAPKVEAQPEVPVSEVKAEEIKPEETPKVEVIPPAEPKQEEAPKVEPAPVSERKPEEPPKVEPKPEEPPKVEPAPASEPKPEEPPKVEPAPVSERKPEEPPKVEPKPEEPPKVEPAPASEPKPEEPPIAEVKPEEPPKAEPKPEEAPKVEPAPVSEPKPEEAPVAELKAEEPPKAEPISEEAPKVEPAPVSEPKPEEPPKAEPKPEEAPKVEPAPVLEPKPEEPPKADPKPEEPPKPEEEPKAEAKRESPTPDVKTAEEIKEEGRKPTAPAAVVELKSDRTQPNSPPTTSARTEPTTSTSTTSLISSPTPRTWAKATQTEFAKPYSGSFDVISVVDETVTVNISCT
ncbi:unnamed protein product [Caenorhabditis auriculariae]|uniref:Uncharacterized protein n=1 Tax=Caenorhabditis auriculariae TaxID=2777116 RepID=A0A8S1H5K9_9PELO|nr:unnamed protein product [Caenorhabditis auriculariae]